jgi:2-iminoacetate synthase
MERFGVGPHTISFPRMQPASGIDIDERWLVNDHSTSSGWSRSCG